MATTTSILALTKPADSDIADIADINANSDKIDAMAGAVQDAIAIVANGNTHAAIAAGQFVYVRNHSTLAQGLYKASAAIGTNAALSTSNLVADGSGGLNDLQGQVAALNSKITPVSQSFSPNQSPRTLSSAVLACSFILITIARYGYADSVILPTSVATSSANNGVKLMYNTNQITLTVNSSNQIVLSGTGSDELNVYVHGFM